MSAYDKYWWLSWYQPTEDYRPLHYPPGKAILGWWCTGERCSDGAGVLVAHIRAADEDGAKAAVHIDWPEATDWRFCKEVDCGRRGDRFPIADWMASRYSEAKGGT